MTVENELKSLKIGTKVKKNNNNLMFGLQVAAKEMIFSLLKRQTTPMRTEVK